MYIIFEIADGIRGSFDTLKDTGIKYVVLLSSYSVKGPAEDERNMEHFIEGIYAKTEVALKESGLLGTAVRLMYLTSNIFWYLNEIRQGEVQLSYPDGRFDHILPADIGTVCGGQIGEPDSRTKDNQSVPLYGPELYTQGEAMGTISHTFGRKIEVEKTDKDALHLQKQLKLMSGPIIESVTSGTRASNNGHDSYPDHAEVSKNIAKYTEREPSNLADWLQANSLLLGDPEGISHSTVTVRSTNN